MKIRGVSEAIATFICSDISDVRDGKYHHGRTGTLQIYVIGNDYMTACKTGRKAPPKCQDEDYNFNWIKIQNDFYGWDIYEYSPCNLGN